MLDYLHVLDWNRTRDFLASGSPPLFIRLIFLNALFLAVYAVRKAAGSTQMGFALGLFTQLFMLGANMSVIFEPQLERMTLDLFENVTSAVSRL